MHGRSIFSVTSNFPLFLAVTVLLGFMNSAFVGWLMLAVQVGIYNVYLLLKGSN